MLRLNPKLSNWGFKPRGCRSNRTKESRLKRNPKMIRYLWLTVAAGCLLLTHATGWAETISEIVKRVKPAVVEVVALNRKGSPIKFGTGFFVSSDGQLITNFHVIEGASSLAAFDSLGARLSLERVISHHNEYSEDLAILKFQVKDVPFLKLRESDDIAEGDKVIVIGNPAGLRGTVSDGIVSGFRSTLIWWPLIQITAPISPGSSGSPVLDENGEAIGIVTRTNNQGQNLNFAITSRAIGFLVRSEWCREYPEVCDMGRLLPDPEGCTMLGKLLDTIGRPTADQYDKAKSIIEKYLADRSALRNNPTLDAAAKEAKLDQLGQEYNTDISGILTHAQKERLDAARERAKRDSTQATSFEEGRIVELLNSANGLTGDEFEAIQTTTESLKDWFLLKNKNFTVPKEFGSTRTVACRVFQFHNVEIGQVMAKDTKEVLYFLFDPAALGVKLRRGEWEIVEGERLVGGVTEVDGTAFLVAFRGKHDDMQSYLAAKKIVK